ncbi:adenylate/guanylate cyclase domain-containing protein [Coleofasciculus sp. E2-BRE-01]|uniref:adenylate/guanylate cyclase domain-containing protein n=1 Tax=Coleofasciculus sp. E2-BRE-01 TaxID=3069524 RepID=UPI0032F341C7
MKRSVILLCVVAIISTNLGFFYLASGYLTEEFYPTQKLLWLVLSLGSLSLILALPIALGLIKAFSTVQDDAQNPRFGEVPASLPFPDNPNRKQSGDRISSIIAAQLATNQALTTNKDTTLPVLNQPVNQQPPFRDRLQEIAEYLSDQDLNFLSQESNLNPSALMANVKRVANFTDTLFDAFSLKPNPPQPLNPSVDLRSITQDVLELCQPLIRQKNLQLRNSIAGDFPQFKADADQLQQILYNLIIDMIKFTEQGAIDVSATITPDQLKLTIADIGITIPAEQLLENAYSATIQQYSSTAVGLILTRRLVELNGGQLRVESIGNQGSRFILTLPISGNQQTRLAASGEKPLSLVKPTNKIPTKFKTSPVFSQSFKILIVDNESVNWQPLLQLFLPSPNYSVKRVSNGSQALAEIEKGFQPNLLIVDAGIFPMDGYELCQIIRNFFSANELPIILVDDKENQPDWQKIGSYRINDYWTKPINPNEMLARINPYLKLNQINANCDRFIPPKLLQILGYTNLGEAQLGDCVQRDMTIMFADIRSFTTLSEKMSPQENFDFINNYFKKVVPTIRQHNGFVDKYIGDAIMAVFPEKAEEALDAAIEMQKQIAIYNGKQEENGTLPISVGMGLHNGSLMLGTIGEEQRMEATVISDAVNLASRLEGLTKIFGASIIFSEKFLLSLDNPLSYNYRFLGKVPVKGRKKAVSVFEAFDGEPLTSVNLKIKHRGKFELGIHLFYSRKFAEGYKIFKEICQENNQDKTALFYMKRCRKFHKLWRWGQWDDFNSKRYQF